MADVVRAELEMAVSEDVCWQLFWTGDDGNSVPIADPVLMDVKDANGQIAMRFATTNDPATQAYAAVNGPAGFIQLTAPSVLTRLLVAGRYEFDLFASVADSIADIFPAQLQQILVGWVMVAPRKTKIEDATPPVLSSNPGG